MRTEDVNLRTKRGVKCFIVVPYWSNILASWRQSSSGFLLSSRGARDVRIMAGNLIVPNLLISVLSRQDSVGKFSILLHACPSHRRRVDRYVYAMQIAKRCCVSKNSYIFWSVFSPVHFCFQLCSPMSSVYCVSDSIQTYGMKPRSTS